MSAAAHAPEHEHDELDESGHAEPGHAEADKAEAANNTDFIADGGVVPLVRDIGKLLFGVTVQAGIDAARGDAKKTEDPHAKHPPEGAHDKAHAKKEEKKEGGDGAHGAHAGHGAEGAEDWLAVALSSGKVLEGLMDGKVDKHSIEHAVDHWLDAKNFGLVRPFAGAISRATLWGLGKVFTLRDHALEKLEPQWETLGRQILTGLPHDEKHGYHAGVENLCHTMKAADIEDNFSKLLSETAFDTAMKTNGGQKSLQKQIARWMGTTDQPDVEQLNKRLDAVLKVLKLEHEAKPGLWGRFKGLFKKDAPHHGHNHHPHHHEHTLEDSTAEKNRQVLMSMLKLLKKKCTDANLTMVYEGKAQEVDLDHLGDKIQEVASLGDAARISFVSSLREGPIKAKFKKLIELDRMKAQLKTPKGREELRGLLKAAHDLETETVLTPIDLDTELAECFGSKGALKEPKDYPNPSLALDNYTMLRGFYEQMHANLKLPDPNNPEQTIVEAIYEDPVVVKYEEFGSQLNDLEPEKAKKFAKAYSERKFRLNFGMLLSKEELTQAASKEGTRPFVLDRIKIFLDLKSGLATQVGVQSVMSGWETTFALAGISGTALQRDIETVKANINDAAMLKLIVEGPDKKSAYDDFMNALAEDAQAVLSSFSPLKFRQSYPLLVRGADLGELSPTEKEAAKKQCKQLLNMVPTNEGAAHDAIQALMITIRDFAPPRDRQALRPLEYKAVEALQCLATVRETLNQANLDKINAA